MQSVDPVESGHTLHIYANRQFNFQHTSFLVTGFNHSAIKNMVQRSVSRGHYSNKFDCNDPQLLAFALYIFHLAGIRESIHLTPFSLLLKSAINHDHVMNPYRDFLSCRRRSHSAWIRSNSDLWPGDSLVLISLMLAS